MKIAVTGATGHIGVNLVPELVKEGYDVKVLIHGKDDVFNSLKIEKVRGDVLNADSIMKFIDGAEAVIHLAAKISIEKKSAEALKVNIEGTRNIINACLRSRVKRLIHFSSIHSLKTDPLNEVLDETRALNLDSIFDYDRSKSEGERMVIEAAQGGLDAIVLNPTAVIGPNDLRPSLLGKAITQFYLGRIPALVDGGYDWVDVRDIVQATIGAVRKGNAGNKYMLSGHWKSVRELAQAIQKAGGAAPPAFTVPFSVAYYGAGILNKLAFNQGEEKLFTPVSLVSLRHGHRNISHEKAVKELGYSPRPFIDTITETLDWFRKNNYIV